MIRKAKPEDASSIVYINISGDEKLFKQLNYFSPPIMLLFFVMSGMRFNLKSFTDMTRVGIAPLFVVYEELDENEVLLLTI